MKFRHFYAVISEDFEWCLILKAVNFYINEMNRRGVNSDDVKSAFSKLVFYSKVEEKDISCSVPFNDTPPELKKAPAPEVTASKTGTL